MLCELLLKQAFLCAPFFALWYSSMHICDGRLTFSLADLFCGLKKMFASRCLKHVACGLLLISGCQCIDGRLYCLILCSMCSTTARKLGRSVYVIHAEKSSSAEEKSVIKQQRWEKRSSRRCFTQQPMWINISQKRKKERTLLRLHPYTSVSFTHFRIVW